LEPRKELNSHIFGRGENVSKKRLEFWNYVLMQVTYLLSLRELRKLESTRKGADLCDVPSLYHGYGYFSNIKAKQVPDEIRVLFSMIEEQSPQRVLEIGTYRGGTFYLWCKAASEDATLISIDLPGDESLDGKYTPERIEFYKQFAKSNNQKLHFIAADSHQDRTASEVAAILGSNQLDFLFIDGDHSYAGAKRDFELYAPLVRSRGIVAFHDILFRKDSSAIEVYRLWNVWKEQYQHREIIAQTGSYPNLTGIGILWKD
jgi:predicted O-methyltransferase YrrM